MTQKSPVPVLNWSDLLSRGETGGQLLIVDDEASVRSAMRKIIAGLGYSVLVAASLSEARACMKAQAFDVVMLDAKLEGDVEAFMGWAMATPACPAVVVTTESAGERAAVALLDLGARTQLIKPADEASVRVILRDALAVRDLLTERNRLVAEG